MRSFYGTIHVSEEKGRLIVSVHLLHDGQTVTSYSSEGSARSFEPLDEGLSVLDGAALAWAIGATPPALPRGGAPADLV